MSPRANVSPVRGRRKLQYKTLYSPSTGFFHNLTYQSKVRQVGWLWQTDLKSTGWKSGWMNSFWRKDLTTANRMNGSTIDFTTELAVKHGSQRFSDWEATTDATCPKGIMNDCYFK